MVNFIEAAQELKGYFTVCCVCASDVEMERECPTSLLWAYYFLAQHFDTLNDIERAIHLINAALDHTMTLIELYVIKAKIYKVRVILAK